MRQPELWAIQQRINLHTAKAESNRQTAEHFLELAEEETARVDYWIEQKRIYLGEVALDNVIPFPVERRA